MRIAAILLGVVLLPLTACAAPAADAAATPAAECAPWPPEARLNLAPEDGRYRIALGGLPPDEPFSLRYTLRRGDFAAEAAFDGRAGPDGAYSAYSVPLPKAAQTETPSAYPAPDARLGGPATYWRFELRRSDGRYCLEVSIIP